MRCRYNERGEEERNQQQQQQQQQQQAASSSSSSRSSSSSSSCNTGVKSKSKRQEEQRNITGDASSLRDFTQAGYPSNGTPPRTMAPSPVFPWCREGDIYLGCVLFLITPVCRCAVL
ncbi:hypothetical protein K0M31_009746 [Melipona bicolor]|uniref:Uncharacterized protein n=1 Tax=Melipona bicolor TaxID=60889 RepID=A0AA40FN97_9HYME|nr:hypothetical protein K0M31_009746 [Melipona bicolor]